MRMSLALCVALSSSLTHAAAAPYFEGVRVTIFRLFSSAMPTQFPFNFIVILGGVSLWRGAWGLMDLHIFPKNSSLSYIVSLVIGVVILVCTYDLAKQFL